MPKLIIVEGVDSTGKSTLSKALAKKLGAHYFHASGHRTLYPSMFAHHQNILDNAQVNLDNGHNVVLDRHWPSEQAYGSVLRPQYYDQYDFFKMTQRLAFMGAEYIICESDHGWERYVELHKDHDKVNYHALTYEQYLMIASNYHDISENMRMASAKVHRFCMEEHFMKTDAFCEQFL